MGKYVVWGCGKFYKRYKKFLEIPGLDIAYIVDSDSSKWDTVMDGYLIKSPEVVLQNNMDVIIAVKSYQEIKNVLFNMGFRGNAYLIWEFPDMYIEKNRNEIKKILGYQGRSSNKRRTAIFDIIGGLGWAGTEMWAYKAAKIAKSSNIDTVCYIGNKQMIPNEENELTTEIFDLDSSYCSMFLKSIAAKLPVSYFCNFWGISQEYAFLAKLIFQDEISFVQIFHSDMAYLYDELEQYSKYMDMVWCVSKLIAEKAKKRVAHRKSDIEYHIMSYSFVDTDRNYSMEGPIKIGLASRLVKEQKRMDLLPDFISALIEKKIDFEINIAGVGELSEVLNTYVNTNGLQDRVHLLGLVPADGMPAFWKQQDVFMSLSSYEGTSLSMVEAMSNGCVPVVTDVSGVSDVITDHYNGIISPVDNFSALIDGIKELQTDRQKLWVWGKRCVDIIAEKCDVNEFARYLVDVIDRGEN